VIDRAAYEKYRSLPAFQARMQHLVRIDDASESRYARIQLTPSYTCPFLSSNCLCGIQLEHGEFYLPGICATYPRLTQRIDGLRETTLLLSCPEAARLVLLNPKLIPSDDGASSNRSRYHRFSGMGSQPARANGSPHQFLWKYASSPCCCSGIERTRSGSACFCFIMENYLVNYVFRTRFPYGVDPQGRSSDPFPEFLKMAVLYALVKGLLIGAAARYQKEFSECHVVKVVQSFAKGVEQNPNFPGDRHPRFADAQGIALLIYG